MPKEASLKRCCAGGCAEGGTQDLGGVCVATAALKQESSMWKFGVEEWKVASVEREFSGTGGF